MMKTEAEEEFIHATMRALAEYIQNAMREPVDTLNRLQKLGDSDYRMDVLIIPFAFNKQADLLASISANKLCTPEMVALILKSCLEKVSDPNTLFTWETKRGGDSRTH
jgi:hypothetical protein